MGWFGARQDFVEQLGGPVIFAVMASCWAFLMVAERRSRMCRQVLRRSPVPTLAVSAIASPPILQSISSAWD